MFIFFIDCRQDRESENFVYRLSLEILMYSNASGIALACEQKKNRFKNRKGWVDLKHLSMMKTVVN
jgi:hypothetical protein